MPPKQKADPAGTIGAWRDTMRSVFMDGDAFG
jgi:hypothetical protein